MASITSSSWADDMNAYIRRALSPANIKQISDIGDGRVVVIVGDEDLSQAIGRGGQNVRLASKLIGKELDIYGQTEFGNMPPEEKEVLFKAREGVKIPGVGEPAAAVAAAPNKFSELESLFSKKKPEGEV